MRSRLRVGSGTFCRFGSPEQEGMVSIEMLGHAPWTTTCVGQGHSITSAISREHMRCSRQSLSARAMVQQSACLLFGDPVRREIRTVTQQAAR